MDFGGLPEVPQLVLGLLLGGLCESVILKFDTLYMYSSL